MEIIKHGNTMMHGKCSACGCEFLYNENDIELSETRINAYESRIDYRYVNCPECGKEIKI